MVLIMSPKLELNVILRLKLLHSTVVAVKDLSIYLLLLYKRQFIVGYAVAVPLLLLLPLVLLLMQQLTPPLLPLQRPGRPMCPCTIIATICHVAGTAGT